jgi:hypothetical protein
MLLMEMTDVYSQIIRKKCTLGAEISVEGW